MYSLSTTKKIFVLAVIIASFSIAAETKEQVQIDAVDADAIVNNELVVTEELTSDADEITELVNTEEEVTELANTEEEVPELANTEEEVSELANTDEEVPELVDAEEVNEEESVIVKTTGATIHACPTNFYQVKLPTNGKLCQVFAANLPASMIFFVPQLPEEVIAFYEKDTTTFSTTRQVKDRVLLQSEDKNTTLIISTDGSGTQVDVLVKASNS